MHHRRQPQADETIVLRPGSLEYPAGDCRAEQRSDHLGADAAPQGFRRQGNACHAA